MIKEIDKICFTHGTKSRALLDEAYQVAYKYQNNSSNLSQCVYSEVIINYAQGINDTAIEKRLIDLQQKINYQQYPFEHTLLSYALSLNYCVKNDYAQAFSYGLQSFTRFQHLHDTLFIAKSLITLASICTYTKSYKMAESYYRQARLYVKPDQWEYFSIRNNEASVLHFSGRINNAIDSLQKLIPDLEAYRQDTGLLFTAYLNLAVCYTDTDQKEEAFSCYQKLLNLITAIDNNRLAHALYHNIGNYFLMQNDLSQAISYINQAQQIALHDHNKSLLAYDYFALWKIYEKKEMVDSAYFYLSQYYGLMMKIENTAKVIESYQAYMSILLESSKKELEIAEKELIIKNRRFLMTLIVSIGIVLLTILLFIIFQQKKRVQNAENRELTERLKNEQEIQRLQEEKIEAQMREITSFSLLLSNKNNVLQQISDLSKHQHSTTNDEREDVHKKMENIIKNNLNNDQDWETFMMHFDKVHPRFFDKLKSICNGLTEHNLRMCAYFRIGMTKKHIAQILNVTPATIKINRHRLRKKLGLNEEDDLDDFLRKI